MGNRAAPPVARPRGGPLRLAAYRRVSTDEMAESGSSLDAQRERVRAHVAAAGAELAGEYADAGLTGGNLDRPGLRAALAAIDRGEADGLCAAKLDRITRSVRDWCRLLDDAFGPPRLVPLEIVAGPVDLRSASGRMVVMLQVVISEWELSTIKERTADVLEYKRARGEAIGHARYGWRVGPDGRTLEADPAEGAVIARMLALVGAGETFRGVALRLDAEGVRTRKGGRWQPRVVGRIVRAAGGAADEGVDNDED